METKKVKVEVVDEKGNKKPNRFFEKVKTILTKLKIGTAIVLDGIDFFLSPIPILNTAWDIVCFLVLLIILKNKRLAYFSLGELIIPGLGPIGLIDGIIPACTIITILDTFIDKNLFTQNINIHKIKRIN